MNSFRSVERAIAFEIERQAAALDAGEPLLQETRGWDDERGETYRMRVKETSDDYRYFPEPDLPPLHLDEAWLAEVRAALPELPGARRARYIDDLGLSPYDAAVLVADPDATALFEATMAADPGLPAKAVANWVSGEYLRLRNAAVGADRRGRRPSSRRSSPRSPMARSPAPTDARPWRRHVRTGGSIASIIEAQGLRPDLRRRRARRPSWTRSSRPTRPPSPTTGPARAGDRLPRRPGHEGDARPGQRGDGRRGRPRAPRRLG